MATAGPRFPGTVASLSNAGSSENAEAWVSPSNAGADDGSNTSITASTYDSPDISQLLVASNFGFSADFTDADWINGITVEIERNNAAGAASDNRIQLATATTFASLVGTSKADTATDWPASMAIATYGDSADTWSAGLTAAQVRATGFAVMTSVQADAANTDVAIDFVRVTVDYEAFAFPFSDGFETGDYRKWDTRLLTNGTITVDGAAAHDGSFGIHIDESSTAAGGVYVRRSFPATDEIRASGWFRTDTEGGSGNNDARLRIFSGSTRILDIYRQNLTGGLWLRTLNGAGSNVFTQLAANGYASLDEWNKMELAVSYGGAGSVSSVKAWIDDVQVLDSTTFDLNAGGYTIVQLGAEHPTQHVDVDADQITINNVFEDAAVVDDTMLVSWMQDTF